MVHVNFIGTGSAFASARQTNIALLVHQEPFHFLIECGPAILHQLDRAGSSVDEITHIFISHRHGDHILGLPMFLLVRLLQDDPKPLTIYGCAQVVQIGQSLVQQVFPSLQQRMDAVTWITLPDDTVQRQAVTPDLHLATHPMVHTPSTSTLCVRLDFDTISIVYTGDTIFSESTAEFAAGCDLLVHEANFSETLDPGLNMSDYGHSTARQAGLTAAQAGCRSLALVHLRSTYRGHEAAIRAEAAQVYTGNVIIPTDGTIILLQG